jgi:hypothetical protein
MQLYHYDPSTGEYLRESVARLDPLESKLRQEDIYLIPANATSDPPPDAGEQETAVYRDGRWDVVDDFRGRSYWVPETGTEVTIRDLGAIDGNLVATPPPEGMFKPQWDGTRWLETAVVYCGEAVHTKADVDRITGRRISELNEEKAKTEKLLAGTDACPLWDTFITARAAILQEGESCISSHGLE